MGLNYSNLDERTRELMVSEIESDIASGLLYMSDNLSPNGQGAYPGILKRVAAVGTDESFAGELLTHLNSHEKPRKLKSGGYSKPPIMRINAHEMLSEGEFNRFYIRALCRRTLEDGGTRVLVYRAKAVMNARSESEAQIGREVDAEMLLSDLRTNIGLDTHLGLPAGPNSGLSVQLI